MKLLGHPLHPMLVGFPLGLLVTSVGFDIAFLLTGEDTFAVTAFYMIIVGLSLGLLAAVVGVVDWFYIEKGTRAQRVGVWHGLGNLASLLLFGASLYLRGAAPGYSPAGGAWWLSVGGAALLVVTGWLGGELVFRLGEAVDDNAHANAPSSLSSRK